MIVSSVSLCVSSTSMLMSGVVTKLGLEELSMTWFVVYYMNVLSSGSLSDLVFSTSLSISSC